MPDSADSRSLPEERPQALLWISLDIVHEAGDWSAIENRDRLVEAAGRAVAASPRFRNQSRAEACVALSDDETLQSLNHQFRGKDKPTNVLSFPAFHGGGAPDGSLGDIVLAQETVMREASEQGIPAAHHLQHLVVPGLLHLLGFDHETDEEASEMEGLETEILATLGIPDPYSNSDISSLDP